MHLLLCPYKAPIFCSILVYWAIFFTHLSKESLFYRYLYEDQVSRFEVLLALDEWTLRCGMSTIVMNPLDVGPLCIVFRDGPLEK